MSHPVWVRGLKYVRGDAEWYWSGRTRVGAWIEILGRIVLCMPAHVAPRVGAWIEIDVLAHGQMVDRSRTPCGCVD